MTSPYDELPKNQANYAPLTPLTFIERAAYVYPDRLSVVHGAQRWTWKRDLCPVPAAGLGAGAARDRQERHRGGHGAEHAADVRGGIWRADVRRGAEHAEHAAGCRDDRLHVAARRRRRCC